MPTFDLDVEIDEFVDNLGPREITELIEYLKDEGHIDSKKSYLLKNGDGNLHDNMWFDTCRKLLNSRLQLTSEEQEIIEKIASRFI